VRPKILIGTALVALLLAVAAASPAGAAPPGQGPGGPVLVIADPGDPFGRYYAEILTAEGLNAFDVVDLGSVTAQTLASRSAVVLAQAGLSDAQAGLLSSWVQGGGDLVAMRPDPGLAGVLGLAPGSGTVTDGYVKVSGAGPSAGITTDTMQFHGAADRWTPAGAAVLATLYTDATTATANPAVTLNAFGAGQAAAFTYDLARSVVWTRQGNPDWAGDERDFALDTLIRSDDLFFGAKPGDVQPDWVDLSKVAIPQADEQQRLLANLLTATSADRLPLPRFWYFPRGERAVVVQTGDDHANNGTTPQFDRYDAQSPAGCSVADWECIRSTSYVYTNTPITDAQAAAYEAKGFEIALHVSTGCQDFTATSLRDDWTAQLPDFRSTWPSLPAPVSNRNHCIAWSDWASSAIVEREHGIRLDTNYYYWPGSWVQNRPGMFTGSGIPMRFADLDGSLVDVYQATTQLTDESGIDIPAHIAALLDGALGPKGYYGVFTTNMHTDVGDHAGANAIVSAATSRGVPVIAARQLLDWLDGRNDSSFAGLSFAGGALSFTIQRAPTARGLQAMLPVQGPTGQLSALTRDGAPVATARQTVKGVEYAVFDGAAGAYVATYGSRPQPDTTPPDTAIGDGAVSGTTATFAFSASEPGARFECRLDAGPWAPCASPARLTGLARGSHTFSVRAIDAAGNVDPTPASRGFTVTASGAATLDRTAPRVVIAPRTVRAARRGAIALRVTCPRAERRCRVDLRVRLGRRDLARKLVTVPGGRTEVVTLRLSRYGRQRLAGSRSLRVVVRASARDAAGNRATTTTRVRLMPAQR
jgi:hypothetical protein